MSVRRACERSQFVLAMDQGRLAAFDTVADGNVCAAQTVVRQLCQALNDNSTADLPKDVGLLQDANSTQRSVVLSAFCLGKVDRAKDGRFTFHGRDRRRLALIVAASLLKLHNTPWIEEQWVRERISFVRKHGGRHSTSPLLEKSWTNALSIAPASSNPLRLMNIRCESLFALGIFLIELCFQKDFSSLQEPGDKIEGGLLECLTEFRTATRLIPDIYNEAGERYGDVVRRCIRCDFDHKSYDLDDEDFCQAVYEGVVGPLEEDVKLIDGADALAECASGFQLK